MKSIFMRTFIMIKLLSLTFRIKVFYVERTGDDMQKKNFISLYVISTLLVALKLIS